MEQLKLLRSSLRSLVTRQINALDELIKGKAEHNLILQHFMVLEERFTKLKNTEDKVVEAMLEAGCSEDELVSNFESFDNYLAKYANMKNLVNRNSLSDANSSSLNESATSQAAAATNYRLPKIELKKFSGDLLEYLPFWSLFLKIHDDPNLRPEDKFHYLLQATVEKSKARELVDSYPPTAENYPKVIATLKSRFGREDLLIEVYIRELLKLVLQNALSKNKNVNLASLYDRLESHLRSLESLKITNDKFAAVLLPLIAR